MKEFLIKNKKYVIVASIMFIILQTMSLIPYLYTGIKSGAWDVIIYLDTLTIFTIVLLCIMLIYREWKINRIRKKTKNWIDPLREEDKATYRTFFKSVIYTVIVNVIIFIMVSTVYYSV